VSLWSFSETEGGIWTAFHLAGDYQGNTDLNSQDHRVFDISRHEISATIRGTDLANGLTSRQETQNAFSRASFKLTDNVELFAQGIWARNKNHNWCCAKEDNADITIKSDNPFIPADVASRMSALNITQFTLGTMNADLPRQGASNDRRTIVATVGAAGSFDLMSKGWSWDAYYEHGVSKALQEATGIVVKSRFPKAIDAVRNSSGQIVCRVNADADPTNNDPGCVPYNVFGTGVNSSAVVDYLTGNGTPDFRDEKYTQDVAAASVNGEPFSTWAGPVSLAFGAEHRRDHVSGTNDPISQASDWFIGNYKVFTASNNVNEGFIETVVPLAEGMVMAKALDLNAAESPLLTLGRPHRPHHVNQASSLDFFTSELDCVSVACPAR